MSIKAKLKSIPFMGSFLRWIYTILTISKIKQKLYEQQNQLKQELSKQQEQLKQELSKQQEQLKQLKQNNIQLNQNLKNQEQYAYDLVRQQIVSQSILFHQKVDTFILSYSDSFKKHQLLIDISFMIKKDLKGGIQRVIKSQIKALKALNQHTYTISTIYLEGSQHYYEETHTPIVVQKGDIIYSADLSPKTVSKAKEEKLYERYKFSGAKIIFLVHDIIPITHPHFFAKNQDIIHKNWLNDISEISDILITTTEVGKKELKNYLELVKPNHKIDIHSIHLGSDFIAKEKVPLPIKLSKEQLNFLVVGTIEPRKAHLQLIQAMDILWSSSTIANPTLIIVGKKGWMVDQTIKYIQTHPQLNKNLFYLEFISDDELNTLYDEVDCLIIPSQLEGFGLPLIEASYHKLPVIARDIPVFREIAKDYPIFFKNTTDPKDIAVALKEFIASDKNSPKIPPHLSWAENAKELFDYIR